MQIQMHIYNYNRTGNAYVNTLISSWFLDFKDSLLSGLRFSPLGCASKAPGLCFSPPQFLMNDVELFCLLFPFAKSV